MVPLALAVQAGVELLVQLQAPGLAEPDYHAAPGAIAAYQFIMKFTEKVHFFNGVFIHQPY